MPLKPLQYLGNFGNQLSNFERENDPSVSEWGSPQLNAAYSEDGQSFRMARPQWAPGEFDEWKQGHMTGMGTEFGRNRQALYNAHQNPALAGMMTQNVNADGYNRLGQQLSPALAALMKGYR